VNPNHLFLGTQTDNMKDAASKGRTRPSGVRGERQHSAKLKEKDVLEIRKMFGKIPQVEIARLFGVTPTAILLIKRKRNWSWLLDPGG
jgi:hypothetical protein